MSTYATIDLNSGYVWWVGVADSPEAACAASDAEGGEYGHEYGAITSTEARRSTGGGYAVYAAPDGFALLVQDGQDDDEIARVSALPLVGYFRRLPD